MVVPVTSKNQDVENCKVAFIFRKHGCLTNDSTANSYSGIKCKYSHIVFTAFNIQIVNIICTKHHNKKNKMNNT